MTGVRKKIKLCQAEMESLTDELKQFEGSIVDYCKEEKFGYVWNWKQRARVSRTIIKLRDELNMLNKLIYGKEG
jgi:hypothetical protein